MSLYKRDKKYPSNDERYEVDRPSAQDQARSLFTLLAEKDTLHHTDFVAVSEAMMDGYARFVEMGLPKHTIALAMLGGAINLYDLFEMGGDLPGLLRAVADQLESGDGEWH